MLYSSPDKAKRANAAYLLGAFMLLVLKQSPTLISQVLDGMTLINFRDAGYGNATYFISPSDCIKGLYKAIEIGLFNIDKFDAQEYEFYEKVENGDMNFITNKFLALASPKDDPVNPTMSFAAYMGNSRTVRKTSFGKEVFSAYKKADLIKFLKDRNIMTIIRLNNNVYEKQDFIDAGIEHIELYFPDGSTPPDGILKRFLDIVESREGCIAVHCKAGLGRTGSLIGAYLMKHYKMTASQTISFLRVVRPGSVVGPQQNWLESMQGKLWKMHPNSVLDTSISLLDSPCFEKSSRFLSPKIVELAARLNGSNSTEDIVMRDIRANSQISLYEMDEDPKQKGSIHALNIDVSLENDKAAKKIQLQKVLQTRVSSKGIFV